MFQDHSNYAYAYLSYVDTVTLKSENGKSQSVLFFYFLRFRYIIWQITFQNFSWDLTLNYETTYVGIIFLSHVRVWLCDFQLLKMANGE